MTISKMAQYRLDNGRKILASTGAHVKACARATWEELSPYLPKGKTLTLEQVEFFYQANHNRFQKIQEELERKDEANNLEKGETGFARETLEVAKQAAYDELVDFKESLRRKYGDSFLRLLRLQGVTPRNEQALLQLFGRVITWCGEKGNDFPSTTVSRYQEPLTKSVVLAAMKDQESALRGAVDAYRREVREDESSLSIKDEAYRNNDRVESETIRIFRYGMGFAGLEEESRRLRPTPINRNQEEELPLPVQEPATETSQDPSEMPAPPSPSSTSGS